MHLNGPDNANAKRRYVVMFAVTVDSEVIAESITYNSIHHKLNIGSALKAVLFCANYF